MHASPPPPPPAASTLLQAFSSPPRTDIAPWRLPDAYTYPPARPAAKSADPLPKKKKNRAAQAERVRRELQLEPGFAVESPVETGG